MNMRLMFRFFRSLETKDHKMLRVDDTEPLIFHYDMRKFYIQVAIYQERASLFDDQSL